MVGDGGDCGHGEGDGGVGVGGGDGGASFGSCFGLSVITQY